MNISEERINRIRDLLEKLSLNIEDIKKLLSVDEVSTQKNISIKDDSFGIIGKMRSIADSFGEKQG